MRCQSWEDELQAVAARQDREAFGRLFNHFAPRIKAYLLGVGASAEAAEEITQEVFVALWHRAATFNPTMANASAWIFTIARNKRIDAFRKERHPSDLLLHVVETTEQSDPETDLCLEERNLQVTHALAEMSQEHREVVRRSFYLGQPHAQIAEQLNLPIGTVKSRLRLAMLNLRKALGGRL